MRTTIHNASETAAAISAAAWAAVKSGMISASEVSDTIAAAHRDLASNGAAYVAGVSLEFSAEMINARAMSSAAKRVDHYASLAASGDAWATNVLRGM